MYARGIALLVFLAATLMVPVWVNMELGEHLGVWWAPYPVWIFVAIVAGVPSIIVSLVPSILFLGVTVSVATASLRQRTTVLVTEVVLAMIVHVGWAMIFSREGVMRLGIVYAAGVQLLGGAVLMAALYFVVKASRSERHHLHTLSAWLVSLWLGWLALPWVLEAV